ncbi:MAG TPA: ion transporter [Methylococcaceae bacterium]|nr:ion transporter [Methylococcaceae bacterium]
MKIIQFQRRLMEILEQATDRDNASKICDVFITTLVLCNILSVILESVSSLQAVYGEYFDLFEFWSVMFFTLEYVLRFWATGATYSDHGQKWRGRREYMFGFYGVVDLLAILPFYLQMLFPGADMRALRILRLVRVLKLSHYNSALEDLFNAVKNEARSFIAALYLLSIAIILTSSLMYYAEGDTQPEHFSSIPASMYWAIITLTTVGFGDISPVTWIGQVLATITAFIGVCTVAMLTGIVASSFATQMARRRVVYESQLREAYKDGILSDEEKKTLLKLRTDFNLSEEQIKSITQQVEDEIKQSK